MSAIIRVAMAGDLRICADAIGPNELIERRSPVSTNVHM